MKKGVLYLIPNTLGQESIEGFLPLEIINKILSIRVFAIEEIKSARRLLKKADKDFPIDDCIFFQLDKHNKQENIEDIICQLMKGNDVGVLSEAGTPCVADPGAVLVEKAHENEIKVKPLIGPSSIILSLMASGLNGQNFTFHGYLPKEQYKRIAKLKEIEKITQLDNSSHLFIETPFRNQHLFDDIIKNLQNDTQLCLAVNLTCNNERITRKSVQEWKKTTLVLTKNPCIFIVGKSLLK
ncbi:MAG: SAM-dependent methyltransferase [Flavobacteriia bacterium]|nr:SAM-dependent methyltransferase [Flavobacteriia bacterium]